MLSNSTPDSIARRFARSQEYAFITCSHERDDTLARVVIADEGYVLVGDDLLAEPTREQAITLWLGEPEQFLVFSGSLEPFPRSLDAAQWEAVYAPEDLRWILTPHFVLWHAAEGETYSFTTSEWIIPRRKAWVTLEPGGPRAGGRPLALPCQSANARNQHCLGAGTCLARGPEAVSNYRKS